MNGDANRRAVPALDPGLVWHQVDTGEWVEGRIRDDRFYRLVELGEGLPLCDVVGAFIGPLQQPKART